MFVRRTPWLRESWASIIGTATGVDKSTLVGTLRETYGPGFAKGRRSDMRLENLLKEEHCKSLSDYLKKR
jgi:hypothetical protein